MTVEGCSLNSFVNTYESLASDCGHAWEISLQVSSYYYEAVQEIVGTADREVQEDLLNIFYGAYRTVSNLMEDVNLSSSNAVRELQKHVLRKHRDAAGVQFDNISQYIDADGRLGVSGGGTGRLSDCDTSFQVTPEFAQLSSKAGYPLDVRVIFS